MGASNEQPQYNVYVAPAPKAGSPDILQNTLLAERAQIRERLRGEVIALGRRGNLNLIIGGVATLCAAFLLAYIVFKGPSPEADWHTLVVYYALRLTVVVFIELFAFFFLRLYRASLDEVKYFQNEITNVELRLISVDVAAQLTDPGVRGDVARELAKTERNFILKSGETTVELEKLKDDRNTLKELAQTMISALKSGRKNGE